MLAGREMPRPSFILGFDGDTASPFGDRRRGWSRLNWRALSGDVGRTGWIIAPLVVAAADAAAAEVERVAAGFDGVSAAACRRSDVFKSAAASSAISSAAHDCIRSVLDAVMLAAGFARVLSLP